MMQVTKTEEVFDKSLRIVSTSGTPSSGAPTAASARSMAGWAIFTPEDNMMVFLKEADNRKNLYQFTLAADWYAPQTVAERLFLLRHDYPDRIGEHEPRRGAIFSTRSCKRQRGISSYSGESPDGRAGSSP